MRRRVLLLQVVGVVGRDDRDGELASHPYQTIVDGILLGHPVTHHLDIEAIAEDIHIGLGVAHRGRVVTAQNRCRDESRHAAGEDDQAVVVLGEQLQIYARLVVVALQETFGDQRDQVAVADQVGGQQRHVPFVAHGAVETPAGCDVRLTAENRR